MENLCTFTAENMPLLSVDEALEDAEKSCIALLQYRSKHHVKEVKETVGDQNIWRLVLCDSVSKEADPLNTTHHDAILCSGCGDIPEDVCKKKNDISCRFSDDLVLVKFQKKTKDIYYVLSDCGEKDKIKAASSVEELECHGKVLCISNGQDPPEAISSEIIQSYFGNYKKFSANLDKRYIRLIKNGDVHKLKREIFDAASIKCAIDENAWTMLHHAAYYGNLEMLHFLTSVGCDGHAQDNICGRKPVIIAAREGHTNIIDFFLLQGLNVSEADSMGWTLLHYAAWKGSVEAVQFLIQKGALVNTKDRCSGKTPLHVASEGGHLAVAQLLVSNGGNVKEETEERVTPLHLAAWKGFLHIVKFLVDRGADLDAKDEDGCTPLHHAANEGHLEIVELLVDRGADLNAGNTLGRTPLHHAANNGHLDVTKLLVDKEADLNARDYWGDTPQHDAAKEGHLEIVELLVNRGADLNAGDEWGRTPLHHAAEEGHLEIVELLVDRGADLNAEDSDGETPFVLGMDHINVASYLANKMLTILQNRGKIDDAVTLFTELLELQKKNLGIVHHETLMTQRKIGEMLYDQCQYSQALEILNDVPHSERNLLSSDFINLRFKCKLKLLIIEEKIKEKNLQDICKDIIDFQNAISGTVDCFTFRIPERNNIEEKVKEKIVENEAIVEMSAHTFTQTEAAENEAPVEKSPHTFTQTEAAENEAPVEKSPHTFTQTEAAENEAPVEKSAHTFTQTEAADFGKKCEYKTSLFLRQSRCIHVGMIVLGFCLLLFVHMLFFAFNHNINV